MEENEKGYSKFEWTLYLVIIPIVFSFILTAILLTFVGFDVKGTLINAGQKIPGLANVLPEPVESYQPEEIIAGLEQNIEEKAEQLQQYETRIAQLYQETEEQDKLIKSLTEQAQELEGDLQTKIVTEEERRTNLQSLAQAYSSMTSSRAAKIIEHLTFLEAAQILEEMTIEQRSAIIGKVDPAYAANLTIVMKEMYQVEDPEMAALQERIVLLLDSIDNEKQHVSVTELANSFNQMQAAQVIPIMEKLNDSAEDRRLAIMILANMSNAARSVVLEEMDTELATSFTKELVEMESSS